jgi:sugar O-acyltransferase (sialic acid O-acetyltransferase NeuD family)
MKQQLILIAASGLAREVMAAVEEAGKYRVDGVLDDDTTLRGEFFGSTRVVGPITDADRYPGAKFLVCAGSGQVRRAIVRRMRESGIGRDRFASVIDRSVRIPSSCRIGVGAVLLSHVVLTADVLVGDHVVAMPHAVLTHDTVIENFATLCSGVLLGGGVRVGQAAFLGMGSSVRQGLHIGDEAVLGMAAALLVDMPSAAVWTGVPAAPAVTAVHLRQSNGDGLVKARSAGAAAI